MIAVIRIEHRDGQPSGSVAGVEVELVNDRDEGIEGDGGRRPIRVTDRTPEK